MLRILQKQFVDEDDLAFSDPIPIPMTFWQDTTEP